MWRVKGKHWSGGHILISSKDKKAELFGDESNCSKQGEVESCIKSAARLWWQKQLKIVDLKYMVYEAGIEVQSFSLPSHKKKKCAHFGLDLESEIIMKK